MKDDLSRLMGFFDAGQSYVVLFSGGFDSCAVLGAAVRSGAAVRAVTFDAGLNRCDADDIVRQGRLLGFDDVEVVECEPCQRSLDNPADRCYHCKKHLVSLVGSGGIIVEGSNADDRDNYRPGSRALEEASVISPLAICGIGRASARKIAVSFGADEQICGLESCLATRINYGLEITAERIALIRQAERFLVCRTGDYDVRCRLDDSDHVRIEVSDENSFAVLTRPEVREKLMAITEKLAMFTTLDLRYYRLNEYDTRHNGI